MTDDLPLDLAAAAVLWSHRTALREAMGMLAAAPLSVPTAEQMKRVLRQAPPEVREPLLASYWAAQQTTPDGGGADGRPPHVSAPAAPVGDPRWHPQVVA